MAEPVGFSSFLPRPAPFTILMDVRCVGLFAWFPIFASPECRTLPANT